jgi:hypothetical protein
VPPIGSGKGAALMAEQLTLLKICGDGGTVYRKKRARALGILMNGARGLFLSRAALTSNDDGRRGGSDLFDQAHNAAHRA